MQRATRYSHWGPLGRTPTVVRGQLQPALPRDPRPRLLTPPTTPPGRDRLRAGGRNPWPEEDAMTSAYWDRRELLTILPGAFAAGLLAGDPRPAGAQPVKWSAGTD